MQVVITPLYQAPSVTGASAASATGAALWQHLTTSFGYLSKEVSSPLTVMDAWQVVWHPALQAESFGMHTCQTSSLKPSSLHMTAGLLPVGDSVQDIRGGAGRLWLSPGLACGHGSICRPRILPAAPVRPPGLPGG